MSLLRSCPVSVAEPPPCRPLRGSWLVGFSLPAPGSPGVCECVVYYPSFSCSMLQQHGCCMCHDRQASPARRQNVKPRCVKGQAKVRDTTDVPSSGDALLNSLSIDSRLRLVNLSFSFSPLPSLHRFLFLAYPLPLRSSRQSQRVRLIHPLAPLSLTFSRAGCVV